MADIEAFATGLDLKDEGDGRYLRPAGAEGSGFVFAGMLTSLLITGASRAVPDKELRSIDALFLRALRADDEAEIVVSPLHLGGQLSAVAVAISQGGRTCAHAQVVLGARADDLVAHGAPMPAVAGPDQGTPANATHPGESKVVDGIELGTSDQVLPPVLSVWRRVPGLAAVGVTPEALLAFDASAYLTGAALLPHEGFGLSLAHKSITAAITASHMVFHRPVDLDDWVLVHNESTFAGQGWAHGRGAVYDRAGTLLVSFALEGMVRAMPTDRAVKL